jgi:hypothetical protein
LLRLVSARVLKKELDAALMKDQQQTIVMH